MCNCKQKSKKPAGTPGNFNYVFTCTKDDGSTVEIKITAGNDNEAKQLAELECEDSKAKQSIKRIIKNDFDETLKLLLNTSFSNEQNIVVTFWGTCKWFNIPTSTIQSIDQIGYGVCNSIQYPLVSVSIKDANASFKNDLFRLKWSLSNNEFNIDLPTFDEVISTAQKSALAKELSGAQWVARFPGSTSISSLISPFKDNVQSFYDALTDAGATIVIGATYRPKERAYLMRNAYDIANEIIAPEDAEELAGVNIEWVHPSLADSIKAAKAMVSGYGIVFAPAYPTKHSDKTAIDMTITWAGTLKVKKADGTEKEITSMPKSNANTDLQQVANTYNIYKLVNDPPHWSDDGH